MTEITSAHASKTIVCLFIQSALRFDFFLSIIFLFSFYHFVVVVFVN